jgi:hypothetical protein
VNHNLRCIDPPNKNPNRQWYCLDCKRQGSLREFIRHGECIDPDLIDYDARILEAINGDNDDISTRDVTGK